MWGYMGNYNWDGGWAWMGLGMIGMLLFWILLIVAIMALAKSMWGPGKEKTPLDILKERYARGEIEREEFEQKKGDLGG